MAADKPGRSAAASSASRAPARHTMSILAERNATSEIAVDVPATLRCAVLVNMPWASYRRPSIQLGLLAELGRRAGWKVETAHLNLDLAAKLGVEAYDAVSGNRSTSLGEWLFARAAFGAEAPDPDEYLAAHGSAVMNMFAAEGIDVDYEALVAFREVESIALIDAFVAEVLAHSPDLVGLTSTFQQNCAAFAFAVRLKAVRPDVMIIAGGANFDGDMGPAWLDLVPAIDAIVSGEADVAFPRLLQAVAKGEDLDDIPNVLRRGPSAAPTEPAAPVTALDELPTPDYAEYFTRAERLGLLSASARRDIDLPFEASRGCWWGERRHCTFCGLNGQTMAFRSKSPERVFDELAELSQRYKSFRFTAVDNILDAKYHKSLLPRLAEEGTTYDLFFEVKSGLSRDRLNELRAAGIRRIQPGIESLSTPVLALMAKGVDAVANVNLLRWAATFDIDVSWNIIWGFPGERDEDYQKQIELVAKLVHLQPPGGAGQIWLERFSPLFSRRSLTDQPIVPERVMQTIYPKRLDFSAAAYFFEYDFATDVAPSTYEALRDAVEAWRARRREDPAPALEYRYAPGFLQIDDRRDVDRSGIYTYLGPAAELYLMLAAGPTALAALETRTDFASIDIAHILDEWERADLVMIDGKRALALALPAPGRTL